MKYLSYTIAVMEGWIVSNRMFWGMLNHTSNGGSSIQNKTPMRKQGREKKIEEKGEREEKGRKGRGK